MTLKVHFDGRAFIPEEPVNLPTGTQYEISLTPRSEQKPPAAPSATTSLLADLAKIAYEFPENPDTPTDLAAQHDHYLYGTPKRP